MDRNTLIGLVLIFAIFAGSFYLMKPTEEELKQEQQVQDSLARAKQGLPAPVDVDSASLEGDSAVVDSALLAAPFGSSLLKEKETFVLENEHLKVQFSSLGGKVSSVEIKGETAYDGSPLVLLAEGNNQFDFQFNLEGENTFTDEMNFEAMPSEDPSELVLRLTHSEGKYIEYVYRILEDSYKLDLDVRFAGLHNLMGVNTESVTLNWGATLTQQEKNLRSERDRSTIFYRKNTGKVDNLKESGDDKETIEDPTEWVAFKQHFFSAIINSPVFFQKANLQVTSSPDNNVVKHYLLNAELPFSARNDNQYSFNFYFGPNKYHTLKAEGKDYEKVIKMGWGPISWINKFITVPIFDFLDSFHLSYGIVILILTLLLKGAMFPLTYKSYQSMGKMRVLKPQLDAIKEKVGGDNPMLLQQEQMKLYKQAGVNPVGGCLPLLLQMPFTLSFFFFFPNLFELRGQSFLWVKDLSTYDSIFTFTPIFGIGHISLMCILMTVTTVLTTWYNNSTSNVSGQMKYIGYFMPLIFFFVLNSFPAGLNYYYFLSAVMTFLTQVIIRSNMDDEKILAKIEEHKKSPKAKKKSGFQKKMEEMMRQQQLQQQQQRKGK